MGHMELFFPSRVDDDQIKYDCEAIVRLYLAASQVGDPEVFCRHLVSFLHHRQGGISDDLIAGLRDSFSARQAGAMGTAETSPASGSFSSPTSTMATDAGIAVETSCAAESCNSLDPSSPAFA